MRFRNAARNMRVLMPMLLLAACADRPPADAPPKTVRVEVPVACVPPDVGAPPVVPSPQELAQIPDGPTRYARTGSAFLALWGRAKLAEPVIAACRAAGAPPTPIEVPLPPPGAHVIAVPASPTYVP